MDVSQNCGVFISAWEGIKDGDPGTVNFDPYMDIVGIWTIGYGHVITDPATGRQLRGAGDRQAAFDQFPGGITKATAQALLTKDMARFSPAVNAVTAGGATQSQFDALVSFDFNTGSLARSTLAKLHKAGASAGDLPSDAEVLTLRDAIRAKAIKTPQSIRDAFAVWATAKGAFVGGLFCRRLAEFAFVSWRRAERGQRLRRPRALADRAIGGPRRPPGGCGFRTAQAKGAHAFHAQDRRGPHDRDRRHQRP